MHSFHPSRGRILFEVFCVLALAASLAEAWMQTGATALLAASAAAALFGLSHGIGLRRGTRTVAAEPQRVDFGEDDQHRPLADLNIVEPVAVAEEVPEVALPPAEPERVKPAGPPAKVAPKAKAPRKPRARRKAPEEARVTGPAVPEEPEVAVPWPFEDTDHPRIEPLFEPEPFVRQPRAVVFGRKAG